MTISIPVQDHPKVLQAAIRGQPLFIPTTEPMVNKHNRFAVNALGVALYLPNLAFGVLVAPYMQT